MAITTGEKFEVWEKEEDGNWTRHESFETEEEAKSYIQSDDWEYDAETEIRIVEVEVEWDDQYEWGDIEYDRLNEE